MHSFSKRTSNTLLGLMLCTSYSFAGVMPLSESEHAPFSKKPLVNVRIISSDSPVPADPVLPVPVLTASVAPAYVKRGNALTQLTQNNGEQLGYRTTIAMMRMNHQLYVCHIMFPMRVLQKLRLILPQIECEILDGF